MILAILSLYFTLSARAAETPPSVNDGPSRCRVTYHELGGYFDAGAGINYVNPASRLGGFISAVIAGSKGLRAGERAYTSKGYNNIFFYFELKVLSGTLPGGTPMPRNLSVNADLGGVPQKARELAEQFGRDAKCTEVLVVNGGPLV